MSLQLYSNKFQVDSNEFQGKWQHFQSIHFAENPWGQRIGPFKIAMKNVCPGNFGKFLKSGYVGIDDKKPGLQNEL